MVDVGGWRLTLEVEKSRCCDNISEARLGFVLGATTRFFPESYFGSILRIARNKYILLNEVQYSYIYAIRYVLLFIHLRATRTPQSYNTKTSLAKLTISNTEKVEKQPEVGSS